MKELTRASQQYPAGARSFGLAATLGRFCAVRATFTRENWPAGIDYVRPEGTVIPDTVMAVTWDRSVDGGNTWLTVGGPRTMPGGVQIAPHTGQVNPTNQATYWFTDNNRNLVSIPGQVRVTVEVLVPLRTAITVQLIEEGDPWP